MMPIDPEMFCCLLLAIPMIPLSSCKKKIPDTGFFYLLQFFLYIFFAITIPVWFPFVLLYCGIGWVNDRFCRPTKEQPSEV